MIKCCQTPAYGAPIDVAALRGRTLAEAQEEACAYFYRDKPLNWPRVKYDLTTSVSTHAHQLVPWLTHEVIRPTVSIATAGSTDHEVVYVNQKLTAFASDPKQVYVAVSRAKGCTHVTRLPHRSRRSSWVIWLTCATTWDGAHLEIKKLVFHLRYGWNGTAMSSTAWMAFSLHLCC